MLLGEVLCIHYVLEVCLLSLHKLLFLELVLSRFHSRQLRLIEPRNDVGGASRQQRTFLSRSSHSILTFRLGSKLLRCPVESGVSAEQLCLLRHIDCFQLRLELLNWWYWCCLTRANFFDTLANIRFHVKFLLSFALLVFEC